MQPFIWTVRVYYEDTDAGGVVYHANYLNFFERARTEMLRAHDFHLPELKEEFAIIFAVRSAKVDYLKPAFFNDFLEIHTEISAIKKASLTFKQTIQRAGVVLCQAEIYVACIDANRLKPKAIPDNLSAYFQ